MDQITTTTLQEDRDARLMKCLTEFFTLLDEYSHFNETVLIGVAKRAFIPGEINVRRTKTPKTTRKLGFPAGQNKSANKLL